MGKTVRAIMHGRSRSYKSPHSKYSRGGRKEKDKYTQHARRNEIQSNLTKNIFDIPIPKTNSKTKQHAYDLTNGVIHSLNYYLLNIYRGQNYDYDENELDDIQKVIQRRGSLKPFKGHNHDSRNFLV